MLGKELALSPFLSFQRGKEWSDMFTTFHDEHTLVKKKINY